MLALLTRLLRDRPEPIRATDVARWWREADARCSDLVSPVDRAIIAGFHADRVAFALAVGYEAALRALVPSLPSDVIASFCATEQGGNHPRAIETTLAPAGDGFTLSGRKRWSTMGPLASMLLVVASEGADATGRKRLRLVSVDAKSSGVTVASMPATSFVPELPHAEITLERVAVPASALLVGDGYDRYVKPFRTVEDIHIHGALLAYLVSVARRCAFPREPVEQLVASIVTTRSLAALDPSSAEVHVALAGLLAGDTRLVAELDPFWAGVDADERARWQRDRTVLGSVAGALRERRRQRAWETIEGAGR